MRQLSLLVAVVAALAACAQSAYRPIPEGDAGWSEDHNTISGGGSEWTSCHRTVVSWGDTVFLGTVYHRLRVRGFCDVQPVVPPFDPDDYYYYVEPWSDLYYFRQDTSARKVFVFDIGQQQELLWYDFSIGLGPYPATVDFSLYQYYVVALDSMELNDGWHRTWVLGTFNGVEIQDSAFCTVVEGVGSTYGVAPLYGGFAPPFEWGDALYCHIVGDSTVYPFGANACYLATSIPLLGELGALSIFPNPASSFISLSGDLGPYQRYTILNAQGSLVREARLNGNSIDVTLVAAGLYMLHLSEAVGHTQVALRFVKE
ncbi:MAG: T9SS type A sorting domain-containing protein [Flavobacteriales bacterium]